MSSRRAQLLRLAVVLWAGSLWALALWITPVLFRLAPSRVLAGQMAGALFRAETLLTLVVAALVAWIHGRSRGLGLYLAVALLAANDFIIRYLMQLSKVQGQVLGLGFGAWHGVSTALYLIACAAAVSVVWQDDLR
ncbi:MAG: hypothetical protein U1F35_04540 [Steroidobacteraceae bacterium]